jgi:hypothetical protein
LTTKLQALVANDRVPLIIGLSAGQRHDAPCGRELLRRLGPARGAPALIMDRADEDGATRRLAAKLGYQPVVPPKSNRRRPWTYDRIRSRRIRLPLRQTGPDLPRHRPPGPHLRHAPRNVDRL